MLGFAVVAHHPYLVWHNPHVTHIEALLALAWLFGSRLQQIIKSTLKMEWTWKLDNHINNKICYRYLAKTMLRSALLEISSRSELKNRSLLEIWNWTAAGLIPKYGQEHNCCCTTKIATIFVHIWELHLKGDILWCLDQTFCHKF